jgi:hypothetical protein
MLQAAGLVLIVIPVDEAHPQVIGRALPGPDNVLDARSARLWDVNKYASMEMRDHPVPVCNLYVKRGVTLAELARTR